MCSATFRLDLLLLLINPCHIISAVTVLQASAQLKVECLIFCVLRDEHLSINASVHFFASPAAAAAGLRRIYHCYIRLAATS